MFSIALSLLNIPFLLEPFQIRVVIDSGCRSQSLELLQKPHEKLHKRTVRLNQHEINGLAAAVLNLKGAVN